MSFQSEVPGSIPGSEKCVTIVFSRAHYLVKLFNVRLNAHKINIIEKHNISSLQLVEN